MSDAVSAEIEIAVPPEEVYEVMMDPGRLGDWVTIHREVSGAPDPPLTVGDSFEQKMALAGKSFKVTWTVTRADAPSAADWEGKGPAGSGARVSYRIDAAGEGSKVRYENEFDFPAGFLGSVAGRLLVRSPARKEAEKTLARLKELLEG
ncbi:MAG TPA: SRPBCC family protein [Solirubrobacterales bacterium]